MPRGMGILLRTAALGLVLTGTAVAAVRVEGGSRAAQRAARGAVTSEAEGLDRIAASVGTALVRAGFGGGSFDLTRGPEGLTIDLRGVRETLVTDWTWDPAGDSAAAPPRLAGAWDPGARKEAIERWLRTEQDAGHPFASASVLDATEDGSGVRVRARYQRGPAIMLRAVRFEGTGNTRPAYLMRASGLEPGGPLRPSDAFLARDRLLATGLFTVVEGPFLRPALTQSADLVYRLVPGRQNRIDGALGYDGDRATLSGVLHVELANLFGTGRRFTGAWESFGADRSSLALAYREPFVAGLPADLALSVAQEVEDTTWTADQAEVVLDADLGNRFGVHGGVAYRRTVNSGPSPYAARNLETILGASYEDRAGLGLRGGAVAGTMRRGRIRRSPAYGPGEGITTRFDVAADRGFPLRSFAHVRFEALGTWVEGPDSLSRLDAAPLGGGGSLRGYPEGAFRATGIGIARVEAGARSDEDGGRAYLFVDGAVFRPWPRSATRREGSYGVGARVRGAGGYVRLDYGVPWGEPPLSGRIHFRLEARF